MKAVTTRSTRGAEIEKLVATEEELVDEELEMEPAPGKVHTRLSPASTARL